MKRTLKLAVFFVAATFFVTPTIVMTVDAWHWMLFDHTVTSIEWSETRISLALLFSVGGVYAMLPLTWRTSW